MSDLVGNPEDWLSHNEAHMPPKEADRNANNEDPDQTVPEQSDVHVDLQCLPIAVCRYD